MGIQTGPLPWRSGLSENAKVGIVGCSNGRLPSEKEELAKLADELRQMGLNAVFSDCIYAGKSVFSAAASERAAALMRFYEDEEIQAIFDISGGDIANELLPYLDFDAIAASGKLLWGYSDLTTILNAVYARTGRPCVLYQARNLVGREAVRQQAAFYSSVRRGKSDLFTFPYRFLRGDHLQGVVAGGNIRCLLKLAGTPWWPDMTGKILLLEAFGGDVPKMVTYLSQLKQMGVFEQVRGILLGTFTQMEEKRMVPDMAELVLAFTGDDMPVAQTKWIGHGSNARAIIIGRELSLCRENIPINENLRLRRNDGNYDFAYAWYQDPETVYLVDGVKKPYTREQLAAMYTWLDQRGELYFIEIREDEDWRPIGDVTFWQEDMPIVIGEKACRGRGIGSAVIEKLVERGRELGYGFLLVEEIYHYNEASRKMFERVGFRPVAATEKGYRYRLDL
ncbi:MAG: GNAT family N-acetyltransferase [Lachnospiraceae bacterium]|nr:GNAT family N-acetyltransferase [Lachnospiraceae bacterium]